MAIRQLGPRISALAPRLSNFERTSFNDIYDADWRELVTRLIQVRGRRCEKCGREKCRIFGDHIVEVKDGGARLDENNVQLLCGSCHTKKTNLVRAARLSGENVGPASFLEPEPEKNL